MSEQQKGWVHVPTRAELLAKEEAYGRSIIDWLGRHFPDLCDPSPHPSAIAAVIRLHWKHGKGALTKREHGPAVRAAVKAWEKRWES